MDRGTEVYVVIVVTVVTVGHVVTGDLTIIRGAKLRSLIRRGPLYREQNGID